MPEPKRLLKVFLCHASQDKPSVRELYSALKAEGWIDPWLDKAKILPGQDWRTVIEKAVENSDVVIVCLSTQSVSKEGFVQREIKYSYDIALEKPEDTIFLIPLRLDDCAVPRGLRSFHWVNYFDAEKNDAYSDLLDALKLRHEQKLRLEEEERALKEKEKQKRETAEKIAQERIARENAEKDFVEKARLEKEEHARQEAVKDEIERKAAEKATREREKRDAAEKAREKRIEWFNTRRDAVTKALSKSFASLKSIPVSPRPLFWGLGIIAIIVVSWFTISPPFTFQSIAGPTSTLSPLQKWIAAPTLPTSTPTLTPTSTLSPLQKWINVPASPTSTPTGIPTLVPTESFLLQEDFEDNESNGWSSWDWGNKRIESNWTIEQESDGNHFALASDLESYPNILYGDKSVSWTDYAFESRVKFDTGAYVNIFIRFSHDAFSNYLVYIFDSGNITFGAYNPSVKYKDLGTTTSKPFVRNQWYLIRVEIKGELLSVYIDNLLVEKKQLPSPAISTQGSVGYQVDRGKIGIDDIKVWSLK